VCQPRRGSGIGLPSCSVEYSQHERFGRGQSFASDGNGGRARPTGPCSGAMPVQCRSAVPFTFQTDVQIGEELSRA
jgi:hypothetical protein